MNGVADSVAKARTFTRPGKLGGLRIKHVVLGCFLLLTFRIFKFYPGMGVIDTLWLLALFVYLILGYVPLKVIERGRFTRIELYTVAVMLAVPFYSAIMAEVRFSQPFIYGLLSQRWIFYGVGALLVMSGLRGGWLKVRDLEVTMVALGWALLVLYVGMFVLLNPASFAFYNGFVGGGTSQPYEFKFDDTFIVFAFFYYGLRGVRRRNLGSYAVACVFLAFMVLVKGGRSEILCGTGAFVFLAMRWSSGSRRVVFIPKAAIGAGALALALAISAPAYMVGLMNRTGAAISVVATGETGSDASANARITESTLVQPYVEKHWLVGNGGVSYQWSGGYQGVLGGYFYPSDVGLLGAVFLYGVFGLFIFSLQLWWAYRAGCRMKIRGVRSEFGDALLGFMLYLGVRSLVTGGYVWHWEVSLTMLVALYWLSRQPPSTLQLEPVEESPA